jgi:hypothetical protein
LLLDVWRNILMNDVDDQMARSTYNQLSPVPFCQLLRPLDMKRVLGEGRPEAPLLHHQWANAN